jgi:hypothetical protein
MAATYEENVARAIQERDGDCCFPATRCAQFKCASTGTLNAINKSLCKPWSGGRKFLWRRLVVGGVGKVVTYICFDQNAAF